MARIRAGNTLTNQYSPPFVVPENVDTNWQLRWSADLKAFEAFDPDENVKIDAGFESIQVYGPQAGTGGQQFILPWAAATEQSLIITIDGVKQQTDAYSISTTENSTTVTLGEVVTVGQQIQFLGLQASDPTDIKLFTATGDNLQTDWILPWVAPSAASLIITIDGAFQAVSAYGITPSGGSSTLLQFNQAPGLGEEIEVVGIADTGEVPASPVDASNLGVGVVGLYKDKTTAGSTQVLNFRSLAAGTGITLTPNGGDEFVTVAAQAFQNLGSGQGVIVDPNTDPVQFRVLQAGTGIDLTIGGGGEIVVAADQSEAYTGVALDYVLTTATSVLGVTNTSVARTVTLPAAAGNAGYRVTIKDESGAANATESITVVTPGIETIDGAANYAITTAYGYVTLYSNGTNYFTIAAG